jgi:hypothetical protein
MPSRKALHAQPLTVYFRHPKVLRHATASRSSRISSKAHGFVPLVLISNVSENTSFLARLTPNSRSSQSHQRFSRLGVQEERRVLQIVRTEFYSVLFTTNGLRVLAYKAVNFSEYEHDVPSGQVNLIGRIK